MLHRKLLGPIVHGLYLSLTTCFHSSAFNNPRQIYLAAQSGHVGVVRILLNSPGVRVDSATAVQVRADLCETTFTYNCLLRLRALRHIKLCQFERSGKKEKQHLKLHISCRNECVKYFVWRWHSILSPLHKRTH